MDIKNVNPIEYKKIFISICRLINSTKKKRMERYFLTNLLEENHDSEVVSVIFSDLIKKKYLTCNMLQGGNYNDYLWIEKKALIKLDKLGIKLKKK